MCIGSALLTIDYVVKSECPEASGMPRAFDMCIGSAIPFL